jgi:hypothetical protein
MKVRWLVVVAVHLHNDTEEPADLGHASSIFSRAMWPLTSIISGMRGIERSALSRPTGRGRRIFREKKPISCWLRKRERGAALSFLIRLQDSIEELGGLRADWRRSFGIIGMAKFGGV